MSQDKGHRAVQMKVEKTIKRETKKNKATGRTEHYNVLVLKCPNCETKIEKNANGFAGRVALCDGIRQTSQGGPKAPKKVKAK